jgi:probable HAF family extracellular repeat protein
MSKCFTLLSLLVLLLPANIAAQGANYAYMVTDLGHFSPLAINSSGQVAGVYNAPDTQYAMLYKDGTLTDLGNLGGSSGSSAFDIDDAGQVVGYAGTPDGHAHAFLYSNSTMNDLGTLGGTTSSAYGINNSGQIVGGAYLPDGTQHAFLYSEGKMNDLGTLGGVNSAARGGVNAKGQITGTSDIQGGGRHGFLYDGGLTSDIGTLGGPSSYAMAINDKTQIVGYSWVDSNHPPHAFIYDNGTMIDINGSNLLSAANAINNNGQVVGHAILPDRSYAFVYENGQMTDLNSLIDQSLGIVLYYANDINNSGQIVVQGHYYIGDKPGTAFLLTPIPEPSCILLLCLGLIGFFLIIGGPGTHRVFSHYWRQSLAKKITTRLIVEKESYPL